MLMWTEKNLVWFSRAAAKTSFYDQIFDKCSRVLDAESRVFDLGCGAGFLSMVLAPYVRSVTGVDIDATAVNFLRKNCYKRGLSNVICQVADWHQWEPEQPADVVFLCYCDGLLSETKKICTLAKEYIVAVLPFRKNDFHLDEFFPLPDQWADRENIPKVTEFLEKRRIPFQFFSLAYEFGQPFLKIEEYEEFLNFYYQIPQKSIPRSYTANYLQRTNEGYYLTNFKESGIVIIKTDDLRQWISGKQGLFPG